MESTFVMIYADGIQRGLVGEIISRFEKEGFHLKGLKQLPNGHQYLVENLLAHFSFILRHPEFLKEYQNHLSGAVACMVWEGMNVVSTGRKMIGETNSEPGTICGDFSINKGRDVIHASDSVENANKEIGLWFPELVRERMKHIIDQIMAGGPLF